MRRVKFASIIFFCLTITPIAHTQNDLKKTVEWKDQILVSLQAEGFDLLQTNIKISSYHYSAHNKVHYVYYQQSYKGIEVYKAIGNVVFGKDLTHFKSSRLIKDVDLFDYKSSYKGFDAVIEPDESVRMVARYLDLPLQKSKGKLIKKKSDQYELIGLPYAHGTTHIRKVWAKKKNGRYAMSWAIEMAPSINSDHWEIVIDAETGSILSQANATLYCSTKEHFVNEVDSQNISKQKKNELLQENTLSIVEDGSQYRVFAYPLESPDQGQSSLLQDPADPIASQWGWHDVNGIDGAEFTILRGNNVHAYQDSLEANEPAGDQLLGGGAGLVFDFPFDKNATPETNLNADLTNLFYWTNFIHDWSYNLGFDEGAGNFQDRNYTDQGREGDYVFAETLDGSDTNNANFSAPRDGANGRMQMFKWEAGDNFDILSPSNISGAYSTGSSAFGPDLRTPLSAEIILINDNIGTTTDACEAIMNGSKLIGKIAMIDRGTCDFSAKVFSAQEAGAIACIVCNNLDNSGLVTMAAGENANLVNIPSLFLSKEDCATIKEKLNEGVTGRFNETKELSSSFDNGIVIHEYGHGISLRLSGGAATSGCLNNDEQMGEGWSDFFALALTQQPDDTGDLSRGIGNYVRGGARKDKGIRRFPYSTDRSINAQVQSHIRFSFRPHDVGEIWANALWDMYWSFIDQDDYDATWADPLAGNVIALQLVFDGLKIQECDPSLLEARDAILQADMINNRGANQCLIWTAFAKRGMGIDAQDGDTDMRYDNVDGFKRPPKCEGQITIEKEMTSLINPGDIITVILNIENYKEAMSDVVIIDQIPQGTTVESVTGNLTFTQEDSDISFNIGNLAFEESIQIEYQLNTDDIEYSSFDIYDDLEGAIRFDLSGTNTDVKGWALTTAESVSGIFALKVAPDTLGGEVYATRNTSLTITPDNQLLKFNHKYETDLGIDGGVVEVSLDQGESWTPIDANQYLVDGYPDEISNCFNNCPVPDFFYRNVQKAFTGESDWQTTVVDLAPYLGQEINLRYNYISLTFREGENLGKLGWLIDDFELYEKQELVGEACILVGGSTEACDQAFSLVNSNSQVTPVTELEADNFFFAVSPNPASDVLNIQLDTKERIEGSLRLVTIDGRVLSVRPFSVNSGDNLWQRDISGLQSGMYFLELSDQKARYTIAFIKQ